MSVLLLSTVLQLLWLPKSMIANVAMNGWGKEPLRRLAEALVAGPETALERER